MPVLLTSKPHETFRNISETLKNFRKLSKRATKPLENGFSLNFDQFPWIFRCTKTKNKASVYFITQIQPKNANIVLNNEKKESQQHPVFPGGHPSKYWLGSMLLNFSDRTRTGVFNMIWPLARKEENFNILFQQQTYLLTSWCIWDFAHRLGWNVVGLNNSDYFYNYPLVSWAFPAVSNPCFLVLSTLCTKHFKDKAELRNLSIFKPKKPDLLFESRLYNPQNILSTFDKHHPNISWYL